MRFGPPRLPERRRALVASCIRQCGLPESIFGELKGMNDIAPVAVGVIVGLVIGVVALFLLGVVLRWLWNTTLPDVIGVKPITTWQAVKILFIASILFGGHRVITTPAAPPPEPAKAAAISAPAHSAVPWS